MMEVVTMLGDGKSIKEIAGIFGVGRKAVEWHWREAKRRLGLRSYVDCCKFCLRHHLITL